MLSILSFHAGHSLGGALGTLAAYDIRKACPCVTSLDISCYTFGAPRTGNHAFAWDYNAAVPDTWAIINDQDAVVRCSTVALVISTSLAALCFAEHMHHYTNSY